MRLGVALACAVAALAATAPTASALPDAPDLVIELPTEATGSRVAPVYVDGFEEPGRLLYRFDAVIRNQGGTLDLFRDPADGAVRQAIWPGGQPTVDPEPDQLPPAGVWTAPRSGGSFEYAYEKTHEHWHFSSAARYELLPAGGAGRVSGKVGFCLLDSYGLPHYFSYVDFGAGGETWCAFNAPGQSVVRMGISPGAADLYSSQREFQWIDITGLDPGPATLRAEANPFLCILESDEANNVSSSVREIPGVRARAVSASTPGGRAVTLALAGEVVAPEVPARRSGGCVPSVGSRSCYAFATDRLDHRVVEPPRHGSVTIAEGGATYMPATGFEGEDAFSYTATDARGLTSRPATARVTVTAPPPSPPAAVVAGARVTVEAVRVRRRRGLWRLSFRASATGVLSGRLERRSRPGRFTRRLRSRRVAAGAGTVSLGRLAGGRYRVTLSVDGRPAGAVSFRVPAPRR